MTDQTGDNPVLDLLASMNMQAMTVSTLDPESMMLVRIAALVAVDAAPVSYLMNLRAAGDVGVTADQVQGVLAAVAPIVGSARVTSSAGKMVRGLGLGEELEELAEFSAGEADG